MASLGDIVELRGLASRPELNGTFAVVIGADDDDETQRLEAAGRVKVTGHPGSLALRPENLVVLSEERLQAIDWTFADGDFLGMCKSIVEEVLRRPGFFLGSIYRCGEFAEHVWALVAKGLPMPPKTPLDSQRRCILNDTAKHTLYFLALDQIGHHVIVETRAGRAKVYQCFVEHAPDENGDSFGFTAREWLTGDPDDADSPLAPGVLEARRRWGGGAAVERKRLEELLDLTARLRDLATEVAEAMFVDVPQAVKEVEAAFQERRASSRWKDGLEVPEGGLARWAQAIFDHPDCVSMTAPSSDSTSKSATLIWGTAWLDGAPFELSVPASVAERFSEAYYELLGFRPQAAVFMMALHHLGGSQGWGVRAATIPH